MRFGRINFSNPADVTTFLAMLEQELDRFKKDDYLIVGGGSVLRKHLSSTLAWVPGTVTDGTQVTTTVSLPGCLLGDEVTCSFNYDIQQMQLTGAVKEDGTIEVVLRNETGADITLTQGTLRVSSWSHAKP